MTPTMDSALHEAWKCAEAGDFAQARSWLEAAPEFLRGQGAWNYARGAVELKAGRAPEAVPYLETAVRLEPEIAEYRSNLGAALLALARAGDAAAAPRALEVLERAAAWGPTTPAVHTNLSVARLLAGDAAGALAAAEQALALDGAHLPALYNRAAALSALGRLEECLAALERLLAAAPGHEPALASRAATQARLGRR